MLKTNKGFMHKPLASCPLVSIITPIRNGDKFIEEALISVIGQTYSHWEMWVINDNSTDNSLQKVLQYADKETRIKCIDLPDFVGAAKARNVGISASNGRYIAFLDADDIWLPTKLEEQLSFMQLNDCYFCFSAYTKISVKGDFIARIGVPDRVDYFDLLKTCVIGCLTVIYDKEYFGTVYMPLINKRQDFGLWLKLLKKIDFAYGINKPLALHRIHSNSLSSNKVDAVKYTWVLFRKIEKLTLLKCVFYFSHYTVRGLLRTRFPSIAVAMGVLIETE